MILNGKSGEAEDQYQKYYSDVLNVPYNADNRVLNFLAAGDFAKATKILQDLKSANNLDIDSMFFSLVAYQAIVNKMSEAELNPFFEALEKSLQQPGFESWSSGVLSSRMVARALRNNGLDQLAARIEKVAIGNHGPSMCGSKAPECAIPKNE